MVEPMKTPLVEMPWQMMMEGGGKLMRLVNYDEVMLILDRMAREQYAMGHKANARQIEAVGLELREELSEAWVHRCQACGHDLSMPWEEVQHEAD